MTDSVDWSDHWREPNEKTEFEVFMPTPGLGEDDVCPCGFVGIEHTYGEHDAICREHCVDYYKIEFDKPAEDSTDG